MGASPTPASGTPADWWGDGRLAEPPGAYAAEVAVPPGSALPPPPQATSNSVPAPAVAALIVAIVSVPFCGVILGPVAIWLGYRARQAIAASGSAGNGVAVAAIVIGVVGLVLNIIGVIIALTNPEFIEQLEGALAT